MGDDNMALNEGPTAIRISKATARWSILRQQVEDDGVPHRGTSPVRMYPAAV